MKDIFPTSLSDLEQNIIRALHSHRQFVYGKNPKAEQWSTEEEDPNGLSIAQYKKEATKGAEETYQKKRLKYLPEPFRWTPRQAPIEKVYTYSGFQNFTLDATGVSKSTGDEELTLLAAGRSLRTTKTSFQMS